MSRYMNRAYHRPCHEKLRKKNSGSKRLRMFNKRLDQIIFLDEFQSHSIYNFETELPIIIKVLFKYKLKAMGKCFNVCKYLHIKK